MANTTDIINAFKSLNSNLTDAATLNAVNTAQEAAQQIKAGTEDEIEQRKQLTNLGQELTSRLAGLGSTGAQLQAAFQSVAPTPEPRPQSAEQAILFGNEKQAASGEKIIGAEQEFKRETLKLRQDQVKQQKQAQVEQRNQDRVLRAGNQFQTSAKKNFEAFDSANSLVDLLNANNAVADQAVKTFAARASGEVGNLTEAEREAFAGSPAALRRMTRVAKRIFDGGLTDADRAELLELAAIFRKGAVRGIESKARLKAGQLAKTIKGDADEIFEQILPPAFLGATEKTAQGATPTQQEIPDAVANDTAFEQ